LAAISAMAIGNFGAEFANRRDVKVRQEIPITPTHISNVRRLTLLIARSNIHRRLRTGKRARQALL